MPSFALPGGIGVYQNADYVTETVQSLTSKGTGTVVKVVQIKNIKYLRIHCERAVYSNPLESAL